MFGFANFLLLALFAAAVFDLIFALARGGGLRGALHGLWNTPHLLFGQQLAEWRLQLGRILFAAGLAAYEISVVFCNSMARQNWAWVQGVMSPVLEWLAFLCFGAKILFGTRYTWRELICAGVLYFVARWVYFNGQNIWFLGLVMVLLAAKAVPLRRSLQAFLGCGVPTLALVEVLHFAGIIAPDALSERSGSYRLMFGYGHPNTFGGIVFGLVLAWVLLRQAKITWAEIAAVAGVGLFLYKGPASRSPALCTFLLAVLLVCAKTVDAHKGRKLTAGLCAAMVPVVGAISYILPLFVVKTGPWADEIGPAWLAKLDSLLTCRISLAWAAYRMYDIKIAGQMLMDWPAIDNIFVYFLYQFGPVLVVLAGILMAVTLYRLARHGRWQAAACLLVVLFYGYMETQVIHITSDPALLLLVPAVFGDSLSD